MIIELTVALVILLMGVSLIVFASRIGMWMFRIRREIRSGFSDTHSKKQTDNKWWLSSWYTLALRFGPTFDIWLIRIIGIGFVVGMILLLVIVLSS